MRRPLWCCACLLSLWSAWGGHWDPPEGYPPDELDWEGEIPVAMCLAVTLTSVADAQAMRRASPWWRPYIDCYIFGIDDRAADEVRAIVQQTHAMVAPYFLHVFYIQHAEVASPGHVKTILLREAAATFPEATHVVLAEPNWRAVAETFNRLQLYVITEGPPPPRAWPRPPAGHTPPTEETCKVFAVKLSEGAGDATVWQWTDRIVSLGCADVLQRRDASPLGPGMPEAWVITEEAAQRHRRAAAGNETAASLDLLVGYRVVPWEISVEEAPEAAELLEGDAPAAPAKARKLASASYELLPALGDAEAHLRATGSAVESHITTNQAAAEAMARGELAFDCRPYHVFSYVFRGPVSHFAVDVSSEGYPAILRLLGEALASSDPAWRAIAQYNMAAALTHLNRSTEAFAVYSEVFRERGPVWPQPQPLRPPLTPLYIVTVASDDGEGLRNLIAGIKLANVACRIKVLGLGVEYKYHGLKLPLYGDFMDSLEPQQLVLGIDAFDTLVLPAMGEIVHKFMAMSAAIVMCGERGAWPDVGILPFYPHPHYHVQPPGASRFPLLNSGVFMGRADNLGKFLSATREQGPIATCGDDQRAFIRQYFADPPAVKIDTEAEIFLSLHQADRIHYWLDGEGRFWFKTREDEEPSMPAVVHFNAMDGKAAYPKVIEWWKQTVRGAGLGDLLEVTDADVLAAAGVAR